MEDTKPIEMVDWNFKKDRSPNIKSEAPDYEEACVVHHKESNVSKTWSRDECAKHAETTLKHSMRFWKFMLEVLP